MTRAVPQAAPGHFFFSVEGEALSVAGGTTAPSYGNAPVFLPRRRRGVGVPPPTALEARSPLRCKGQASRTAPPRLRRRRAVTPWGDPTGRTGSPCPACMIPARALGGLAPPSSYQVSAAAVVAAAAVPTATAGGIGVAAATATEQDDQKDDPADVTVAAA